MEVKALKFGRINRKTSDCAGRNGGGGIPFLSGGKCGMKAAVSARFPGVPSPATKRRFQGKSLSR